MRSLAERCRAIRLLALDVDGCLTAGGIGYATVEKELPRIWESKLFHVRDGSGLVFWHRAGRASVILTGRSSRLVQHRADELGIAHVAQGLHDKLAALDNLLQKLSLTREQVAFVGDDLPDLTIMQACGLAVAVADGCPEVRMIAHYITQARGGQGAVRETIERILRCQGLWPDSV